eukprot:COSAG04_NODE_8751_length_934_cov_1.590419_2_plen_52_part_01
MMKPRLAMIGVLAFALTADGQNGELTDDDGSGSWVGELVDEPEPEPEPEARC